MEACPAGNLDGHECSARVAALAVARIHRHFPVMEPTTPRAASHGGGAGSHPVPLTENTVQPAPGAKPPAARIEDAAWLAGRWIGEALGARVEEVWSPPVGRAMCGHFRLDAATGPRFFELLLLVEETGSLAMKVKHFSPEFHGWEEKDACLSLPLAALSTGELRFSGLTIRRDCDDGLSMWLAMHGKDGAQREESFRYRRAPL